MGNPYDAMTQAKSVRVPVEHSDSIADMGGVGLATFFLGKEWSIKGLPGYGHLSVFGTPCWYKTSSIDDPVTRKSYKNLIVPLHELRRAKEQNEMPKYLFGAKVGPDYVDVMGFIQLENVCRIEKLETVPPELVGQDLDQRFSKSGIEAYTKAWRSHVCKMQGDFEPAGWKGGKMGLEYDSFMVKYWDLDWRWDDLGKVLRG